MDESRGGDHDHHNSNHLVVKEGVYEIVNDHIISPMPVYNGCNILPSNEEYKINMAKIYNSNEEYKTNMAKIYNTKSYDKEILDRCLKLSLPLKYDDPAECWPKMVIMPSYQKHWVCL